MLSGSDLHGCDLPPGGGYCIGICRNAPQPRADGSGGAAAANGRKGGRPRKVDDADAAKARQLRQKGITATDIAKMLGGAPRCTGISPTMLLPESAGLES